MKKCQKCGAPLEGFLYNTIGKLLGIKPSEKNPEICNKCEAEKPAESAMAAQPVKPAEPVKPVQPVAPAAPATPEEKPEEKDDLIS